MADISTLKKYKIILEEFEKREDKKLTGYDEVLSDILNLSPKQIDRLIKELSEEFDNIIEVNGTRRKTYQLIKPIDLFVETFDKSEEIGWFFNMAQDADPDIFKELEQFTNENKNIYKFQNSPFEDISTLEEKDIFKSLKRAVKNREYIKLRYKYIDEEYDNLKCLKLVFIDNNWYLAFIDSDNKLQLSRVSFIKDVGYASKLESFQKSSVKEQMLFLNSKLQNAMTLFGVKLKVAKLKINPYITRYFEKDMKKFLKTQRYMKKLDDGSIIITVEYTQYMEILPFIQSWMPNMIILEPKELKDAYIKRLNMTILNHI
ncbi:WYL domain-containing protein [Poseidonibacter antarcticus]|uniref:WYL domain-containing protein n=1 Tax=Poseidonibacter antarcticus TaxID=2478538 RepID=UPI000EF4B709|nr:WYL domain-containing protein [Poseidonibacter antarcticus]